jgi:hypothetical protein
MTMLTPNEAKLIQAVEGLMKVLDTYGLGVPSDKKEEAKKQLSEAMSFAFETVHRLQGDIVGPARHYNSKGELL